MGRNIYYYITTLHYFISLKTTSTQKRKMFLYDTLTADIVKFTISVLERNF